jgi:SulP family sulfate permease
MIQNYINMLKLEFQGYNRTVFLKDFLAGVTTTAVALPLAIAFGVSSGMDASSGLITAIVAGILISILSGAYFQISGPTGAMAAILVGLFATYGVNGIFLATFLAGIFLLLAGVFKLGTLISFIPTPVITGFTSGIAIIIALGQVDNFFGVKSAGAEVIEKLWSYRELGFQPNVLTTLIGITSVLILIFYPKKWNQKFPASLLVIVLMTGINAIFHLPIDRVGEIPRTLFSPHHLNLTDIQLGNLKEFIVPAISIALLGMIESLLCGAVAGRMVDKTMDANIELVAQGVGNMVLPFFGGIPATAAIARTSVAIKSGSRTRVAGMIHALGLLAAMLLFSKVMSYIPLSALAGVLMVTAWRMNEWESIAYMKEHRFKGAGAIFLLTLLATVVLDLSLAIVIGFIAALLIFVVRNAIIEIDSQPVDFARLGKEGSSITGEWEVVYITGPLFFMSSERIKKVLKDHEEKDGIIFSMRGVPSMDMSIVHLFETELEKRLKDGKSLLFSSYNQKVAEYFKRSGMMEGERGNYFYPSVNVALEDRIIVNEALTHIEKSEEQ